MTLDPMAIAGWIVVSGVGTVFMCGVPVPAPGLEAGLGIYQLGHEIVDTIRFLSDPIVSAPEESCDLRSITHSLVGLGIDQGPTRRVYAVSSWLGHGSERLAHCGQDVFQ
jgi:hypothetical protein